MRHGIDVATSTSTLQWRGDDDECICRVSDDEWPNPKCPTCKNDGFEEFARNYPLQASCAIRERIIFTGEYSPRLKEYADNVFPERAAQLRQQGYRADKGLPLVDRWGDDIYDEGLCDEVHKWFMERQERLVRAVELGRSYHVFEEQYDHEWSA